MIRMQKCAIARGLIMHKQERIGMLVLYSVE